MQYVFAGNFKEFMDYCHENDLHPKKDAFFVNNPDKLYGRRLNKEDKIIYMGTCSQHRDFEHIYMVLQIMDKEKDI